MRGEAAVSLLLFQLEKLLKAQSCFPKNMFPSLYTRAGYDFQTVKYGKKVKTSILLGRIKASFRNRLLYQVYHLLPTSVLREKIHHCLSLFSGPILGEDGWAQAIYSAC